MPFPPPRLPRRRRVSVFVLVSLALLAGCATRPPPSDPDALAEFRQNNDPLEPTNRVFYAVNNAIDTAVLAPAARGYRAVVPEPVRNGIHNLLDNLTSPMALVNNILSAKPRRAGNTFMRMVINSTVGIGGVLDVAKNWGYPSNDADFGLTMAVWGVPSGPFLFLPVLGPTDPRDAAGFGVNIGLDPFTYMSGGSWTIFSWTRYAVSAIDARERRLNDIAEIKRTALDPYATFRSLYQQFRSGQIDAAKQDLPRTVPAWFPNPQQDTK
jgi:phospholipid-binding lipoprotein MlaA